MQLYQQENIGLKVVRPVVHCAPKEAGRTHPPYCAHRVSVLNMLPTWARRAVSIVMPVRTHDDIASRFNSLSLCADCVTVSRCCSLCSAHQDSTKSAVARPPASPACYRIHPPMLRVSARNVPPEDTKVLTKNARTVNSDDTPTKLVLLDARIVCQASSRPRQHSPHAACAPKEPSPTRPSRWNAVHANAVRSRSISGLLFVRRVRLEPSQQESLPVRVSHVTLVNTLQRIKLSRAFPVMLERHRASKASPSAMHAFQVTTIGHAISSCSHILCWLSYSHDGFSLGLHQENIHRARQRPRVTFARRDLALLVIGRRIVVRASQGSIRICKARRRVSSATLGGLQRSKPKFVQSAQPVHS